MKKTVKNLLIAQNYSDAAKGIEVYKYELHFKQIEEIIESGINSYETNESLYKYKDHYLKKAFASAKKENIKIYFDRNECALYFEFPFGQCSFHSFMGESKFSKNVEVVEKWEWSGKENTRRLLQENYLNRNM